LKELFNQADAYWTAWLKGDLNVRGVPSRIVLARFTRAVLRERMIARGSAKDLVNVANWEAYSISIDEEFRTCTRTEVIEFDNNDESAFRARMRQLVDGLPDI
jgi:hypothetical protein